MNNTEWIKFFKSTIGKEMIADIESMRDSKISKAMQMTDSAYSPNEGIVATMSQAKGIEEVLTYLKTKHELAKLNSKGDSVKRGM